MIDKYFIKDCFSAVKDKKAIIPYIDIYESLRKTGNNASKPIDRNKVKIIQTPQCFELSIIKKAYKQEYKKEFTDDATVYESLEKKDVHLIKGLKNNIKITVASDLNMAEYLLKE